ncbi:MAG TPA: hypothetical protein VN493_13990 [Thermoanaerobaculia bacterium]|nr:hypothetical protein [Thermoanaerobaculia bacterium]
MRARWLGRALSILLAALTLVLVVRAIAPWDPMFESPLTPRVILGLGTWGKFLFLLVASVASTLIVGKFEPRTTTRTAWLLLCAGIIAICLGQACFVTYQFILNRKVVYPSLADIFFMISYPLVIGALVLFLRAYKESGFPIGPASERVWLAAGVALLCAVGGYPILKPLIVNPGAPLKTLLNVLYPILDCILLILAVLLIRISLRFRGGTIWRVWVMLLGGFVSLCAGDTLFAYYLEFDWVEVGDLIDALFLLGYGLVALGIVYQRELLA